MPAHAPPSHYALWRALENRVDVWVSLSALTVGLLAFGAVLAVQIV